MSALRLERPLLYRNVPVNISQEMFDKELGRRIEGYWKRKGKKVTTWVDECCFDGLVQLKTDKGEIYFAHRKVTSSGVRSNMIDGLPRKDMV